MTSEEKEDKPLKSPTSNIPLEVQCRRAMDSIVTMRIQYTEHLRTEDAKMAKKEAALLQKKMRRKIKPTQSITLNPSAYKLLDRNYEKIIYDKNEEQALIAKIETLANILTQVKNDNKGILLREPIDSESILNKVKTNYTEIIK